MSEILLQAHRGVSTEYPENTVSSVLGAVYQGYKIIEVDPAVTLDGEIVLLHDGTINRTARCADLSKPKEDILISDITYKEALSYDFGIWFSEKFKGEKIPLLSDILKIAKENGLLVKIDNKFQSFSKESLEKLFDIVEKSGAKTAFTCNDLKFVNSVLKNLPDAEIHYDGAVTEEIPEELSLTVPKEKLVVWLPFKTPLNTWVQIPFADEELCREVKKYARLGLWILSEESEYNEALRFSPDIIETTGKLKPIMRKGVIADMHTHSEHSHDSSCKIADMAVSEKQSNVKLFAVTDHCDIEYYGMPEIGEMVASSVNDAKKHAKIITEPQILSGAEIGGGFWHKPVMQELLLQDNYDVIIGSVHTVKFDGWEVPYSTIDFGKMGFDTTMEYLDQYFKDVISMLETTELDIMAHLTCPLRYINGKFGMDIHCHEYSAEIEQILKFIISHGIALEINTSCKGSAYDELMPEDWIIKMYRDLGGYLITLGSDAHIAGNAAHYFKETIELLKSYGFKNVYYYKNRYVYQCAL